MPRTRTHQPAGGRHRLRPARAKARVRVSRVLTHTVIAAASLTLLSSAPYAPRAVHAPQPPGPRSTALPGADGGAPLFPQPPEQAIPAPTLVANATTTYGIPATVLDAYKRSEASNAASDPSCHLPWPLLAAIGQVESGHARGGNVDPTGRVLQPILGPALNGTGGNGALPNVFGARYDQQGQWMRAAGPMQFLPSTWTTWGADGNGDGTADPENVYDAALAAGHYLCAGGGDLANPNGLQSAILSYNHSQQYLATVLSWMRAYGQGGVPIPDQPNPGGAPVAPATGEAAPPPAPPRTTTPKRSQSTSGSSGSGSGSTSTAPTTSSSSGSSGSSSGSGTSGGSTPTTTSPKPQPSLPLPGPVNNVVGGVTGTLGGL